MKLLKRKPIIIAIVLLALFLIVGICAIKINSNKNKKSYSTSAIVSEKKEKAKSDKGKKKLKDSNEDNKVETNEVIKKEEEKKNEDDEKKDSEVISDTNNNQSLSISSNNNSNNGATNNSSNSQSSNNNVNNNVPSVSVNTDEQDWNNFINDYSTLLILGGNIDFYSQSEQVAESNKWVNLGYRTELPTVCTYLSTGQRCVYSLFVFAGEGTCGTSTSISVNWRSRNYISDIDYLKSLGYNCP